MISGFVPIDRPMQPDYDPVAYVKVIEREGATPQVCSLILFGITDRAEELAAARDISSRRQAAYCTAIERIRDIISIPPPDQENALSPTATYANQLNRLQIISNFSGMLAAFASSPTLGSRDDGPGFSVLADMQAPNRAVIHVPLVAQDASVQTDHAAITAGIDSEHWIANEFTLARVIRPAEPSDRFDINYFEENSKLFDPEAHVTVWPLLRSSMLLQHAIRRM